MAIIIAVTLTLFGQFKVGGAYTCRAYTKSDMRLKLVADFGFRAKAQLFCYYTIVISTFNKCTGRRRLERKMSDVIL